MLFTVIYFCGIWAFSSSRKHLLITLLRLEFVVLVLYFPIYFYLCRFDYSLFFVVYFLVVSVCEGSLGLKFYFKVRIIYIYIYKACNPTILNLSTENLSIS